MKVSLKSDKSDGHFNKDGYTFLITSRSVYRRWEMFRTKFAKKIKTHIWCSI